MLSLALAASTTDDTGSAILMMLSVVLDEFRSDDERVHQEQRGAEDGAGMRALHDAMPASLPAAPFLKPSLLRRPRRCF
jgi:hypothetical protein